MLNAILFTIVFLWLISLSARQASVSYWLKTYAEERDRVLKFIDEYKASAAARPAGENGG